MALLKDGLVSIYSQNIEASIEFYMGILGMQETYRFPKEGAPEHVEFRAGATTVAVSSPAALVAHGMPEPSPGHPFQLGFHTDDVDELIENLRSKGVPILREPFDIPAGNRLAYFTDPDGTWISVYHKLTKPD